MDARAAGAYRFVLRPGVTTALDVDARLFLRKAVRSSG
jgi:glucan biosynthesis protein